MIEARLEDGRRIFVPIGQVKAITEDGDKNLTLVFQNPEGKLSWSNITSFQLLGTGKRVS